MKFTKGQHDRAAIRHWVIEANGQRFTAMAERGYRNNRPGHGGGHVTWTIFIWRASTDGNSSGGSVVEPFEVTRAPREAVAKVLKSLS